MVISYNPLINEDFREITDSLILTFDPNKPWDIQVANKILCLEFPNAFFLVNKKIQDATGRQGDPEKFGFEGKLGVSFFVTP